MTRCIKLLKTLQRTSSSWNRRVVLVIACGLLFVGCYMSSSDVDSECTNEFERLEIGRFWNHMEQRECLIPGGPCELLGYTILCGEFIPVPQDYEYEEPDLPWDLGGDGQPI